jgi:DNA-binding XRE family transcriptional regulator
MIKNNRQQVYSQRKLKELEGALQFIKNKYSSKPNKARLISQGYLEHIKQIKEEISEYERIKTSSVPSILRAKTAEDLRRKIIELRILRGLTQADLAKKMGCEQSDVSRMEKKGYKGYSLSTLNKIGTALNANIEICFIPRPISLAYYPLTERIATPTITCSHGWLPFRSIGTDDSYSGEVANA